MKNFNNPEVSIVMVSTCDVIATSETMTNAGTNKDKGIYTAEAPMRELFEDEEY